MPAGSVELDFLFNALSYTAPEKVTFAYLLENVDSHWLNLGNHNELHFRELVPGEYILHLKAANNDGFWNETGTALAFTIQPFFWQTLWFRILGLMAVAGGGGFAVWRMMRHRFQQRLEQLQQQRLFEQEHARLAAVMENTSDLVAFADSHGEVLHINPAGQKILGLAQAEEWRALKLSQLQPRWAADQVAQEGIPAARQHGTWEAETALLHRDGREIPVSQVIIAHKDKAGCDVFLSTIARDITERKRAESTLAALARRHQTLLQTASEGIHVLDEQGKVVEANAAFAAMLGYTSAEVLQLSIVDWDAQWSRAELLEKIGILMEHPAVFETRHRRKDGTFIEVEISAVSVILEGRRYLYNAARDITARKLAEESHARLATVVEQTSEAIVITDTDGTIVYANPAFTRATGYTPAEAIGRNPRLLKSDKQDAEFYRQLWDTLKRGEVWHGHFVNRRKDGTLFEEEAAISPMRDATGKVVNYVAVKRDVTREVQLEGELRQAQKMEGIGQLAGGVAHDFNNILSALLMQIDLVGMVEHLPGEAREGLQQIAADARRAVDLTRQLLLFSRRQVMQPQLLDLNELVLNLTKMLQRIIREDVHLQLHLNSTPLRVRADAGMIDQVLMNLAVNARDAMSNGGELRIETSGTTVSEADASLNPDALPGRYVCLSVSDTGGGIPPEILPRIFEPFFTTKEVGKGTGLGLATVFGIVKQHRGWIKLDNRPGQGVTFHVFLPASPVAEAEAVPAEAKLKPRGGTETVLLVEDDAAVRRPTRKLLERHGYQILEAADGMEALKVWQEYRGAVSLLLTDLVMPGGVGGQELARRLRAEQPKLKVVYVSGYSADIAGQNFQLLHGEAFVQKPYGTVHLLETLRQCLDG